MPVHPLCKKIPKTQIKYFHNTSQLTNKFKLAHIISKLVMIESSVQNR